MSSTRGRPHSWCVPGQAPGRGQKIAQIWAFSGVFFLFFCTFFFALFCSAVFFFTGPCANTLVYGHLCAWLWHFKSISSFGQLLANSWPLLAISGHLCHCQHLLANLLLFVISLHQLIFLKIRPFLSSLPFSSLSPENLAPTSP